MAFHVIEIYDLAGEKASYEVLETPTLIAATQHRVRSDLVRPSRYHDHRQDQNNASARDVAQLVRQL